MKKFITVFLSIITTVCSVFMLSACNNQGGNTDITPPPQENPDDNTPQHTHNFGEWIVIKSATCTTEGSQARYCDCGEVQTSSIGALGHDLQHHAAQKATCTEKGWEQYDTCSRCDYSTYKEVVPLNHDLIHHDGQAASFAADGWEQYDTCSRCDYSTYKIIPALKHNLVEHSGKAATCTQDGWEDYVTCTDCDYTTYTIIPSLGHDILLHEGKAATCTQDGWKAYDTCSRCDYTTYEKVSALGHSIQHKEGKTATCTEKGYKEYDICSRCDYSTFEEIAALGHNLQHKEEKAATCTEKGWTAYEICSRCDYSTFEEISALGHNLQHKKGKTATCTETGWAAYEICSRCDYTTYKEVKALGHDIHTHEGKAATCTESGWEAYETCSRCEYTTFKQLAALSYTQNLAYTLSADGTYYILSGIGDAAETYVRSLPEVNGKPVKEVAANSFADNTEITELYLPECVTVIGAGAFENCSNLSNINLFNRYTSIGEKAFAGTEYFNNRTNWIENILYIGTNLISVRTTTLGVTKIREGTILIADGAYSGCANIVGLEIPQSLRYIGSNVFDGCTSLESISIPDSVESVEFLTGLTSLKQVTIPAHLASCVPQTVQNLTVTSGNIAENAFKNLTSLINITVKDEVVSIGAGAFNGCNKIENITLPFTGNSREVEERNAYAAVFGYIFGYTTTTSSGYVTGAVRQYSLQKISISGGSTTTSTTYYWYYIPSCIKFVTITGTVLPDCAFFNCGSITDISLPNGISQIGSSVFYNCSQLKNFNYIGTLPAIPHSLFYGCNKLESITINENVTAIGVDAFNGCSSLKNISLPKGLNFIGESAFRDCGYLTIITIPDGVTFIGESAFSGCSNLSSITIPESATSIGESAFDKCNMLEAIFVDEGNASYASQDGILYNKEYTEILYIPLVLKGNITIPNGVKSIADRAFSNREGITQINISESVTTIGSYAFSKCIGLTEITLPEKVRIIGDNVFSECDNVKAIIVNENNSFYASQDGILYNKAKTEFIYIPLQLEGTVTIPENITAISASAFKNRINITKLIIPDSVTAIGNSAFYGCDSLESISLPYTNKETPTSTTVKNESRYFGRIFGYTVTTNEYGQGTCQYSYKTAFDKYAPTYYCFYHIPQSLKEVVITSGDITSSAFNNCSIQNIIIGDNVTQIYDWAFDNCSLENLTIGSKVSGIGEAAFTDCKKLKSVAIPDNVTSIGGSAFYNCISLTSVKIGNGVTTIGLGAFAGCIELMSITIPDSVTKMGYRIFLNCSSLTNVTIGKNVTSIGYSAFSGCSRLTSVYYNGTEEDWNNIEIGSDNLTLTSATRYYYSETNPYEINADYTNRYWHYDVDGVTPVVWEKES